MANQVDFLLVTNQEPEVVEAFMEKHGYTVPVHYTASAEPGVFKHSFHPHHLYHFSRRKNSGSEKGCCKLGFKGNRPDFRLPGQVVFL